MSKKIQLLLLNQLSREKKIITSHLNFTVFAFYIPFADIILFE